MAGQHNKIINVAARKILAPEGLFRVGSSRRWIDDNGYFVIQVEFQSEAYEKGSALNVGISFLWETSQGVNETLAYMFGCSVDEVGYVSYAGDDAAFAEKMEHFAEVALEKVREYRLFRDMDYAKEQMESQLHNIPKARKGFWEVYNLAMLCFLKRDFRKSKGLSQQELAIKLNVVRQTISKWEQGLSVPDSEMLISLSEVLETPVSKLLGETVAETEADNIKAISEKLEVINLQLAQRKTTRRKVIRWLLISLCAIIVVVFVAVGILNSPYLGWDYSAPETAVLGVAFHSFEWLFVRVAPIIFIAAIIGIFFTFKKE